ncbi:MAG: N-6 DNA methylase, partial [Chloroflexi bacterium]|nr:N-6 DNA methylase [Chloroflexota bacterium]
MAIANGPLQEIVIELASRPGHEKVRYLVTKLLVDGLDASSSDVQFEKIVKEVNGRIDGLLGSTVFEFKSDLRRERPAAQEQLLRYLTERESATGRKYLGIATDGADFESYELRNGDLHELVRMSPDPKNDIREILLWLSPAVAINNDLEPTSNQVIRELGNGSIAWIRAQTEFRDLWHQANTVPDIRLKRDLWAQQLERVYGSDISDDDLFFQHTYLSIVVKTMAHQVIGFDLPSAVDLLSGQLLTEIGIGGAIESDFFDWILDADGGEDLVTRIANHTARFRLQDVQIDVLKVLYESLIDPDTRHDLGEYYTPDWLAHSICVEAIDDPLNQRVLDPACGSGTFVFHSVRRLIDSCTIAGIPESEIVQRVTQQVFGIDIHPVAVQVARVTYLLALGRERLLNREGDVAIPVYFGDALQWNTSQLLADREVLIGVPGGDEVLQFPFAVASDPILFDRVIAQMLEMSEGNPSADGLTAWLKNNGVSSTGDIKTLVETYSTLCMLVEQGRDHIWGFVARNLVRPVWLAQPSMKVDVLLGNPPWLAYRHMNTTTQVRFKDECVGRNIWAGGNVASHQDLSAYFFVRAVELYLHHEGVIAFVMPYAAMSRRAYEGFRSGLYSRPGIIAQNLEFTKAWMLRDQVYPP